jgi:Phospholipase_D-nuclease N-terminal
MVGYDDGRVACTDHEIIIRGYSFWHDKRISYQAIREVNQVPNRWRSRTSGSGDLVHWLNRDPGRLHKDTALVIHLDGRVRPVITPDDPGQVAAELAAHGVTITEAPEAGKESDERHWRDLSPRARVLIRVAGVAAAGLLAATLIDIKRRPASQIRGSKRMWTVAVLIQQPFGPLSYLAFGRRPAGPPDRAA